MYTQHTVPTPRDWLAVSSKTAPSLFVAAARLLDYAQKSPGTGRLTTCAVTCHRQFSCAVLQPSAPASGEFSSACIVIQSMAFSLCCQGLSKVAAPGTSQTSRAETSRDLVVDRSTANDRTSRDMCYKACHAARVAPLRSAPSQEHAASKRDRPCVTTKCPLGTASMRETFTVFALTTRDLLY